MKITILFLCLLIEVYTNFFCNIIMICLYEVNKLENLPGQTCVLQGSFNFLRLPHHPPFFSLTFLNLVFSRVPLPHEREQCLNSHSLHSQGTFTAIFRKKYDKYGNDYLRYYFYVLTAQIYD